MPALLLLRESALPLGGKSGGAPHLASHSVPMSGATLTTAGAPFRIWLRTDLTLFPLGPQRTPTVPEKTLSLGSERPGFESASTRSLAVLLNLSSLSSDPK